MSSLKNIPFDEEPTEVKQTVKKYWSRRAESFSEHKHAEMHSEKLELWRHEFSDLLEGQQNLEILDVGCGTGFFEAVLATMGHRVTGIDLTPEMIEKGRELLAHHGIEAELQVMDAEKPEFEPERFDVIVSRNLVWTLPHPVEAYQEWYRVLKPGGVLLNYDAEYAKGFHTFGKTENLAHKDLSKDLIEQCHDIYHMLSISSFDRPAWDLEVLPQIGFREVTVDTTISDRIYAVKDEFYTPDRIFGIRAVK